MDAEKQAHVDVDLTGLDILRWLEEWGAHFCKVSAWNSMDTSPGKNPNVGGAGWQNKPLTVKDVTDHFRGGANVGLLAGKKSGGLCILDADESYLGFCEYFGWPKKAPTFVRAGADKGKILIRIAGDIPEAKKFKHDPKDKAPFFEYLADGYQGVIAGSHPSGAEVIYHLLNSDQPIPEFMAQELNDICISWAGQPLEEFEPEPEVDSHRVPAYDRTPRHENGDGLCEAVLAYWDTRKVFEHYGRVNETKMSKNGEWMKLRGNGGLFLHYSGGRPDNGWCLPGEKIGGGPFQAWWWCETGTTDVPKDRRFYELLCAMARAGNIPIPPKAHRNDDSDYPPIPWVPEDDDPFSQWPGNPEPQAEEPQPGPSPAASPGATPASHERFELFNVMDALQPQPPIKSVVDKVITAGGLGVPYGEPGAKKTYTMLNLGVKVATGGSWLGFSTTQMPVLFIDEESGKTRLKRRLAEILRGEGINTSIPMYCFSMAGFHADDLNDQKILQTYIEEYHIGLVIIDALADIMTGDENSKEDVQPIFTALRRICDRTGAAILIIHHSNKAGGYRGSSAIKGAVDLLLKVESEDGQNVVFFSTEKNRDADAKKWAAVCTWLPAEETFTLKPYEAIKALKYNDGEKYVIRFLTENGASSIDIIESCVDSCSANSARKAVYSLVDKGIVYRTNQGGKGIVALYALREEDNGPTF